MDPSQIFNYSILTDPIAPEIPLDFDVASEEIEPQQHITKQPQSAQESCPQMTLTSSQGIDFTQVPTDLESTQCPQAQVPVAGGSTQGTDHTLAAFKARKLANQLAYRQRKKEKERAERIEQPSELAPEVLAKREAARMKAKEYRQRKKEAQKISGAVTPPTIKKARHRHVDSESD
jgi:hypothetical protein